jgi:hypothetical protein
LDVFKTSHHAATYRKEELRHIKFAKEEKENFESILYERDESVLLNESS